MPRGPIIRFLGTASSGAGTVSGSGALVAASPVIAGSGTRTITGTGALVCAAAFVAGTVNLGFTGSGALVAQAPVVAGSGIVTEAGSVSGSGELTAQAPVLAGAGVVARVGTGVLVAQAPVLVSAGVIGRTGSGALEAGAAAIVGSASSATPGECPTTDEIVAAVMAYEVESGVTVLEALRYILAAVSGVTSKTGDTRTFDAGGNPGTVRIAATVDAQGNRSSVTLT